MTGSLYAATGRLARRTSALHPARLRRCTLPAEAAGTSAALAAVLRERLPDRPVTTTSTLTYIVATRDANAATTAATHHKRYRDEAGRQQAEQNYRWLASLGAPLHLPRLLAAHGQQLVFEHVSDRPAEPKDLTRLASHLGAAHGSAYAAELPLAWLSGSFSTAQVFRSPGSWVTA